MSDEKLDLALQGKCPYCGHKIKGYKPPFGAFAPEAFATLREMGIDPGNGHKQTCRRKDIRL